MWDLNPGLWIQNAPSLKKIQLQIKTLLVGNSLSGIEMVCLSCLSCLLFSKNKKNKNSFFFECTTMARRVFLFRRLVFKIITIKNNNKKGIYLSSSHAVIKFLERLSFRHFFHFCNFWFPQSFRSKYLWFQTSDFFATNYQAEHLFLGNRWLC